MFDFQAILFRAALHWDPLTALVVAGIGLLAILQGFRFAKFILVVACGGGGFFIGSLLGAILDSDPLIIGGAAGLGCAALPLWKVRVGAVLASTLTFTVLAHYLGFQFGLRNENLLITTAVGTVTGFCMLWICPRTLLIMLTVLQGGPAVVLGFIGLAAEANPALATTVVGSANAYSFLIPVLLIMLAVMGYSVQLNSRQGNIASGGSAADLTPTV